MMRKDADGTNIDPDSTTLTTAYTGWVSDWYDCVGLASLAFLLTIVKNDATTITLMLEVEDATGTTGFRTQKIASGAASDDTVAITCSALAATDYVEVPVDCRRMSRVRLKAKKTGGSGTVTMSAQVIGGGP